MNRSLTYKSEALFAPQNHNVRRPGETRLVSVRPAGEILCLLWPLNQPFWFFPSSDVYPRLSVTFFSVSFLIFLFCLPPSCHHLVTVLSSYLDCNPDSSPALGTEGLRRNFVAMMATLPPPAVGYSLWRSSALVQFIG